MIKVVAVGKLKEKALQMLCDEYIKRLRPFTKIEIIEVKDEQILQTNSEAENSRVKRLEGARLLSKIKDHEYVILLDLWGMMIASEALAEKVSYIQTYRGNDITFVIAGSIGPGDNIITRADFRWKLSDLTFTHQMTRVIVLEQFYRSCMILNHNPYHK